MHGQEVDEKVANALLTKFEQGQIYHDDLPENGNYPMIQYTDLTVTPSLHADNALYGYEHTIRVTIVTHGSFGVNALINNVFDCMTEAGFVWQNTSKAKDGKELYTAMDFSIGVLN